MGQMLRGGRSWPSERKLGAGAESAGKMALVASTGDNTVGAVLASGVIEPKAEHTLHLSGCPPSLWSW
jgi:hypothetical protein